MSSSDDDSDAIHEQQENDLIECTRQWFLEILALQQGQPHGMFRIEGEDWNMHLRENTGGGCNARDLWNSSLWTRMRRLLPVQSWSWDPKTYDLTVTW